MRGIQRQCTAFMESVRQRTEPTFLYHRHSHLAPFSIMDSIAGLKKAMNETQQVYGEIKMSEMQSPATMEKMQKAMMIESDTTLNSLLSPKTLRLLINSAKKT